MTSRLYLIIVSGLLIAYGMAAALMGYERYQSAITVMLDTLERDVGTSVAFLDRLTPAERPQWLGRIERDNYRFILGPGSQGQPLATPRSKEVTRRIAREVGPSYGVHAETVALSPERYQVHLTLHDGSPITLEVMPHPPTVADWLPVVFVLQLASLLGCAWLAVRSATRPLADLADAAARMTPTADPRRLPETGPTEVAQAAIAFNAMQDRIGTYLKERLHILASISHDLQTPITRMRLRAESLDECPERDRLLADLAEMEHLVREGVAYARSAHGVEEKPGRIDVDAFLDSLVCDYQDTGKDVSLSGSSSAHLVTRPHALRRILGNLVDNALKYAGSAEVAVQVVDGNHGSGGHGGTHTDAISICVQDHGPGIPPAELEAVLQPFYRLENSRNRDTGGTGLGLAIAQQLATAIGATLTLRNREGGGLSVELLLPAAMETTGS